MSRTVAGLAIATLACGWLAAAAADDPPNTLTEAERRSGWRLLFDGRSTDGFRNYGQRGTPAGWTVKDGVLVNTGTSDLVTVDAFDHFDLVLDYRLTAGGTSGVLFHVTETDARPELTAPEVLLLSPSAPGAERAGWMRGLFEPKKEGWVVNVEVAAGRPRREMVEAERPADAWNQLYLRVAPQSGEVCLNSMRYYRFQKGDPDWESRAKEEVQANAEFGKAARGPICLRAAGGGLELKSIKVRELDAEARPMRVVEDAALPVKDEPAFPGIEWEGWSPVNDDGTPAVPLRSLTLTHAGDGSGRRFVLDQVGMIHVVPREPDAEGWRAKLFLDLRPQTAPWRTADEEGLLGLAFHPRFREKGEFFICYCVKGEPRRQRISRFRVSADDPDRADPASEEVLLEFPQPMPNHNGGSIAFGPDGFLYAGIGDGGGRDDILSNGQRLSTLLGKILRIDVDRRDPGLRYAIPTDGPFVGRANARPEIFAFGLRNPWQISFDRETGELWTADVGQSLREEINRVEKGGNYGWSLWEGTSPFGPDVTAPSTIAPVWEYDHQIGKSITGGFVVRRSPLAALEGGYLYGDYVAGKIWLLRPHADQSQTVNAVVPWNGLPIFGFGQDEAGVVYVLSSSPTGQSVYRLVSAER